MVGVDPAALVGAADPLPQRPDEAEVVQLDRAQAVHHPADAVESAAEVGPDVGEHPFGPVGVGVRKVGSGVGGVRQAGQRRAEPVVQFPLQAYPFHRARLHRGDPGTLDLLGQRGGVQGDRQRCADQLQRLPIGGVQFPLAVPQTDRQGADDRPPEAQWQIDGRPGVHRPATPTRRRPAGAGSATAAERRPGPLQDVVEVACVAEPPADPARGLRRVGPGAVEGPVDQPHDQQP